MNLINGKDISMSLINSLPQVGNVLTAWFQSVEFDLVTKTIVDFKVSEVLTPSSFMGVIQPMGPEQLKMMPEGERSWDWSQIHSWPDLILNTDDIIKIRGVNYRVMKKTDWKDYGYIEYSVIKDYQP